jgi:large subunit ribosomal protein L30
MASSAAAEAAHLVKITLVKCGLHKPPSIRKTLEALGLKKLHSSVYHKNIRPIRGMIYEVILR